MVDKACGYLADRTRTRLMHYAEALRDGLPIATGVIEGACRYLVKDRMDRTGARWSLTGAEAVLRLRAVRASGDFDAYWQFHLARGQGAQPCFALRRRGDPRPAAAPQAAPAAGQVIDLAREFAAGEEPHPTGIYWRHIDLFGEYCPDRLGEETEISLRKRRVPPEEDKS